MTPLLLIPILAVLVGPEQEVAPPRLGVPPTHEMASHVVSNGRAFLVGYSVGFATPFASRVAADGTTRYDVIVPSPAGNADAIASDGEHYLTVGPARCPVEGAQADCLNEVVLLDERGGEIRRATVPFMGSGHRSVVWTGDMYLVAGRLDGKILGFRVGRDGVPAGDPFPIATNATSVPYLAFDGANVIAAVVIGNEIHLFSIDANDRLTLRHVMRPANPTSLDFVFSGGRFYLLVQESIVGATSLNLYFLSASAEPLRIQTLESLTGRPGLVDTPDGVIVHGERSSAIVAQKFSPSGEPLTPATTIFRARDGYPEWPVLARAARVGTTLLFAWSERLAGSASQSDVVIASVSTDLTADADENPDGELLARGASARVDPDVAVAGDTTLVVWREEVSGDSWIAGSLIRDDVTTQISISSVSTSSIGIPEIGTPRVASDGSGFLIVWTRPGITELAVEARVIRPDGSGSGIFTLTDGEALRPAVAAFDSGYVVAWEDPDRTLSSYYALHDHTVQAVRLDTNGARIDSSPRLLAGPSASGAAIASDGERLLLAWVDGFICRRALCALDTPLDLKARLFDSELEPLSSELVISADPATNEQSPDVAASGGDFLVAWAAVKPTFRSFPSGASGVGLYSDIGYANVSRGGFVGAAHRPTFEPDLYPVRKNPAVAWGSRHYLLTWSDSGMRAARINRGGLRQDADDLIIDSRGTSPAVAQSGVGEWVSVYMRSAPERGIGAAPQAFLRQVYDDDLRRRAAGR